jgi:hypothetical protein
VKLALGGGSAWIPDFFGAAVWKIPLPA